MQKLILVLVSLAFVACSKDKNEGQKVISNGDGPEKAISLTDQTSAQVESSDFCLKNNVVMTFDSEAAYVDGNWARQATPMEPTRTFSVNGEASGWWSVSEDELTLTWNDQDQETSDKYKVVFSEELGIKTSMSLISEEGKESLVYPICGAEEQVKELQAAHNMQAYHDKKERN